MALAQLKMTIGLMLNDDWVRPGDVIELDAKRAAKFVRNGWGELVPMPKPAPVPAPEPAPVADPVPVAEAAPEPAPALAEVTEPEPAPVPGKAAGGVTKKAAKK